jgi:hypothetical protein
MNNARKLRKAKEKNMELERKEKDKEIETKTGEKATVHIVTSRKKVT